MKSLHKFTSLALLMLFVSMFFVEDAFACSGAYYGWKWANNKNATGLTAKMCSRDFYYNLGQFTRNYTQTTKRVLLTTNKG